MKEIDGIEYCATHGGIMTEGTDYHPDGLGCEYAEMDVTAGECVGVPLFIAAAEEPTA